MAAFYDERFGLSLGLFEIVWTLSGASFFLGNLFIGGYANSEASRVGAAFVDRVGCRRVAIFEIYFSPALPVAPLVTALLGLATPRSRRAS